VPEQAQNRPHLRQLLTRGQGGVIFTTIQKFLPDSETEETHPLLSDRRNVIVMADEAHRTQYGFGATYGESTGRFARGLAKHMRDALPNATFVAFTGTPLSLADRDTQVVFGDYIDVYDIGRAIADGATVPIYYESRLVKLDLPEDQADLLDQGFEEVTEDEEESQKQKLSSRWSQQEAVVGTAKRIRQVAEDLVQHYEGRQAGNDGKVMIVAMSRRIAVDLYDELVRLKPEWHGERDETGILKVVITGNATDDERLQMHARNKERRERLADRFKDPNDHFGIVIVRDMWLTGFDAPSLHTIYIDKPMKGHGLMQAIARVNRVFEKKEGGLVVDYLGLADNLRAALRSYIREDHEQGGTERPPVENTTLKVEQLVAAMQEKLELCREVFVGFDYRLFLNGTPSERVAVIADALDFLFARDGRERREKGDDYIKQHGSLVDRFQNHALALQKAFSIVSATKDAQAAMKEITFFVSLKASIDKTTGTGRGKGAKDLDAALRQLVDQAIAPEGVVDIFATAGLPKPDIGILSDAFLAEVRDLPQRNLALELLRKLLNDEISAQRRSSVIQAKRFSERLEASIARYHNRAIEMSEIIEALIDLAQEMNEASKRGERLGLSTDEVAFYDAITANESAIREMEDAQLRLIAAEVAATVRTNATIDWTVRETARANLRRLVRRVLRRHGYPPDKQDAATDLVIEQAELLGGEWAA
jgi:type I restriction enzyme R subunit